MGTMVTTTSNVITSVKSSRSSSNKSLNHKGIGRYTYHDLNSYQKRFILKQLNLANRHGKQSYKFKQMSPSLCRVICLKEGNQQLNTPTTQRDSTTEDSGDSDEDSYVEGEDTPIEATVKPILPQSIVIGGIRPFGAVNFNGMDDFGPDGEPARDIPHPDNRRS